MDGVELYRIIKKDPFMSRLLRGILYANEVIKINSRQWFGKRAFIINASEHWLLLVLYGDYILYIDPLGKPPSAYSSTLAVWLKNQKCPIKSKLIRIQPNNSELCGLYILYFLYFLSRGFKYENILQKFNRSNLCLNDMLVSKFALTKFNFKIKNL